MLESEATRPIVNSRVETSTSSPILSYETRNNASRNDVRRPFSAERWLNLQERLTPQTPIIMGMLDDFLQMSGSLSPSNLFTAESPSPSVWAVLNAPGSRPLLLTQRKTSTISQSLSSNHVSCFFQVEFWNYTRK